MTDYKTMRVPKAAWEAAKDAKREKETWGEFIQRCTDNPPAIREFVEQDTALDAGAELDTEALAAEIRAELDTDAPAFDEIQRAVRTIEERTGRIEQTVEDMEGRMR